MTQNLTPEQVLEKFRWNVSAMRISDEVTEKDKRELWDALATAITMLEALDGGVGMIASERKRQVSEEGWTPEHDLRHDPDSLARAAACYACPEPIFKQTGVTEREDGMHASWSEVWPFDDEWWKPKDRLSNLVRAGALIAAEIDATLARLREEKT